VFSADWCARVFDLGTPLAPLQFAARGQTNPLGVHRLDTDRGTFAIKALSIQPSRSAVLIEQSAARAGVAMMPPVAARSGEYVVHYEENGDSIWARAYPWLEGQPGCWWQGDERSCFEVARLMAQIHRLVVPVAALDEPVWQAPDQIGWEALVRRAREQGQGWSELLLEKTPFLLRACASEAALAPLRTTPSQRDYHFPNLMTTARGEHVLVDWDAAGPTIARIEAVRFALVWATPERGPPQRDLVRAFVRGYTSAGGEFAPPSLDELAYVEEHKPVPWWIWYNVQRELSPQPSPDPTLLPILLGQLRHADPAWLKQLAALFH